MGQKQIVKGVRDINKRIEVAKEKAEEEAASKDWKVVPWFKQNAEGMPRIIDVHGHPLTKTGITALASLRAKLISLIGG